MVWLPLRLCGDFENVNAIHDHNLRGSSTRFYIPRPKTEFLKKASDIVGLNYGIRCLKKYGIQYRITRSVQSYSIFLDLNLTLILVTLILLYILYVCKVYSDTSLLEISLAEKANVFEIKLIIIIIEYFCKFTHPIFLCVSAN